MWPGEDVELDRRLTLAGHRLVYVPDAIVQHKRPANLRGFARMMYRYGFSAGQLTRRYGFFRALHAMPLVLLIGLLALAAVGSHDWRVLAAAAALALLLPPVWIAAEGADRVLALCGLFWCTMAAWHAGFAVGLARGLPRSDPDATDIPPGPAITLRGHRDVWWLVVALTIYAVLVMRVVATRHYWPRYDSGAYISAAVALSQGLGLRDITSPVGRPDQVWAHVPFWVRNDPHAMATPDWPLFVQYPPGLPVLLAPLVRLGRGSFLALQVLPIACGLLALLLVYCWRRELFPRAWQATLLLTAGSMATLYATRVQSETVMLPLVLLTMWLLWRINERPARTLTLGLLVALVLLAAAVLHTKIVFVCLGTALWLVIRPRTRFSHRLAAAALVLLLTVLPIALWMHCATWAPPADGKAVGNPYLLQDGGSPEGPSLSGPGAILALASRLVQASVSCLASVVNFVPGMTVALSEVAVEPVSPLVPLVVYGLLILGLSQWREPAGGALALVTSLHLAGCYLSPWGVEPRFAVPVEPFLIYGLVLGFIKLSSVAGGARGTPSRAVLIVAIVCVGIWDLAAWWAVRAPAWDWYAAEHYRANSQVVVATALRLPPGRVCLVPGDNDCEGLLGGHATVSLAASEWKESSAPAFLQAGGRACAIAGPAFSQTPGSSFPVPRSLRPWALKFRLGAVDPRSHAAPVAWVGLPPDSLLGNEPAIPSRIHARWLNLRREDVPLLWRQAFGSTSCRPRTSEAVSKRGRLDDR
jgi:hypothetical protein